jgi:hypothetical protein
MPKVLTSCLSVVFAFKSWHWTLSASRSYNVFALPRNFSNISLRPRDSGVGRIQDLEPTLWLLSTFRTMGKVADVQ